MSMLTSLTVELDDTESNPSRTISSLKITNTPFRKEPNNMKPRYQSFLSSTFNYHLSIRKDL